MAQDHQGRVVDLVFLCCRRHHGGRLRPRCPAPKPARQTDPPPLCGIVRNQESVSERGVQLLFRGYSRNSDHRHCHAACRTTFRTTTRGSQRRNDAINFR